MTFDIFISHNSVDKQLIEPIVQRLEAEYQIRSWLDKWDLHAAKDWEPAIQQALNECTASAVVLGANGWGPYHLKEARLALERRERHPDFKVIPVLLPGANRQDIAVLEDFFQRTHRVDFSNGMDDEEAFRRLLAAVRGEAPGPPPMTVYSINRDGRVWQQAAIGEKESLLYRGSELRAAQRITEAHVAMLSNGAVSFLNASAAEEQHNIQSERRRNRKIIGSLVAGLVLIAASAIFAFAQRSEAVLQRGEAVKQAAIAEQKRQEAETQTKIAQEQTRIADEQKLEARTQREIAIQKAKEAQEAAAAERVARNQAEERRREAERQQKIAFAGQTSARSEVIRNQAAIPTEIKTYQFANTRSTWPDVLQRSLLLSIEGASRDRVVEGRYSLEAAQALGAGLSLLPRSVTPFAHDRDVEGVTFTDDGSLLITEDEEHLIRFWAVDEKKLIAQFKPPDDARKSSLSPKGHYFATSAGNDTVALWEVRGDMNASRPLWIQKEAGESTFQGFTADEKQLITWHQQWVTVWDTASGVKVLHLDHQAEITALGLSPDGQQLVTAGGENARMWNRITGREMFSIPDLPNAYAVAFSRDGKVIAIGHGTKADIWNAANGQKVKSIVGIRPSDDEAEYIIRARFSQDGKRLAVVGDKGTTQLWDVETGEEIWVAGESYNAVPVGDYIVIKQAPGVEVWDPTLPKEVARVLNGNEVTSVAYEPVNKLVALAAEKTVWLYDTGSAQAEAQIAYPGNIFRPGQGDKYVAVAGDKFVPVWDIESAREIVRVSHDGLVNHIAFSEDEKYMATTGEDQTLRIWEVPSGREVRRIDHIPTVVVKHHEDDEDSKVDFVSRFFFSASGKYLVIVGNDMTAYVWEVSSGRQVAHIIHDSDVSDFSFSSGEQYFATVTHTTTTVFDTATGRKLRSVLHKGATDVVFSADSALFATAGWPDNTAKVWATATGEQVAQFTHEVSNVTKYNNPGGINRVAFNPDGAYLFTASSDKTARVWDIAGKREIARIPHGDAVGYVGLSPDGKYLITACRTDHSNDQGFKGTSDVYLWDIKKKQIWLKASHRDLANHFVFSADGRYFATASADHTAQVFDVAARRRISVLNHDARVNSIEFSPDGKHLATSSSDNVVRVWETLTGREVARMTHEGEVFMARFSRDGTRLSTASMDKTMRVWSWRPEDLIAKACSRLTRNLTRDEWRQYFGQETYKRTCPNLPAAEKKGL